MGMSTYYYSWYTSYSGGGEPPEFVSTAASNGSSVPVLHHGVQYNGGVISDSEKRKISEKYQTATVPTTNATSLQ